MNKKNHYIKNSIINSKEVFVPIVPNGKVVMDLSTDTSFDFVINK